MNTKVKIITTARALVFNNNNELLLVKNHDSEHWFTPGGWLDGFETLEETVVREVFEELGIKINPVKLVKIDYYKLTAKENIKWKENINKIEHYYLCEITEGEILSDAEGKNLWEDKDAGNTAFVKFFSKDELQNLNAVPSWIKNIF